VPGKKIQNLKLYVNDRMALSLFKTLGGGSQALLEAYSTQLDNLADGIKEFFYLLKFINK
jgi:hypothetical protein